MKIVKRYFLTQRLAFAALGFDIESMSENGSERILKYPWLFFVLVILTFLKYTAIFHYAYVNANNIISVANSFSMVCQGVVCITKLTIFFFKRRDIMDMVSLLQKDVMNAQSEDLAIIREENARDVFFCNIYSLVLCVTGWFGMVLPFVRTLVLYIYNAWSGCFFTANIITVSFLEMNELLHSLWDFNTSYGYVLLSAWNMLRIHTVLAATMGIDTLYSWLITNIVAQFRILSYHFQQAGWTTAAHDGSEVGVSAEQEQLISDCIGLHNRIFDLVDELNRVYGTITFVKFVVSSLCCCCSIFFINASGSSQSAFNLCYQGIFFTAVTLQLATYCYNGQRISDESELVATKIYLAFPWPLLPVTTQRSLLMSMIRAQQPCEMRGVFFKVDLSLFVWVFKTAGSLIAVLQYLDEAE
ncbi:odorant receptor 45a-like [Musca autumnalis]|uniref:odorant receptor 45a-like n=1 Tax=Musca autumnalis TaxID=221902 RepID=UPI003CECF5E6